MTEPNKVRVGDRVTIHPRGKKKIYVADFWQDAIHRKVSLRTSNKKAAVERATKIAADLHQGVFRPAPPPVAVPRATAEYVVALRTADRAVRTIRKYECFLRNFTAFLDRRGVKYLHQVTAGHFDAWRAERRAIRHPGTVYDESVVVKQLFKWAKTRKPIPDNPLADVRLDKPPREPKPAPGLDEVDALLAVADATLRHWLTVLAFTGMRVGELQRLRVEDVDPAGNGIHIRSRRGAETKTRDSRKVPIHPRLRAVLQSLSQPRQGWFFTAGPSAEHPGGNWINPNRMNDRFADLLRRLGLPAGRESGFTTHSLRHFFETFAVNAGIPQRVIDTWLGHRSDRSMAAVYYRLRDEESQLFMARVPFGTGAPAAPAGNDRETE